MTSKHGGFELEVDMIVLCVKNGWKRRGAIRTIYGDQTSHISPIRHVRKYFQLIAETREAMRR